ncbi:MAG: hypothetical protein WCP57_06160 [Bacteroidota bacterium]
MQFSQIVGQQYLKQKLIQNVRENRLAHATMLLGAEGTGGLAIAMALAQYLMCENKGEMDSCGTCSQCIKNEKMIHPDLHFMYPNIKRDPNDKVQASTQWIKEWRETVLSNPYISVIDWINFLGKGDNKQGNITKGDCHETIKKLSLKTYESPYKIQIIWLAEYLGLEGNTLLKLIEEPPKDCIFILVVENIEQVINTIISRTQIIKIPPIDDQEMKDHLMGKYEISEESAKKIVRIADGSFSTALKMLDGDENTNDELTMMFLKCSFKKAYKQPDAAKLMDSMIATFATLGREKQKNFCKYALFYLRECLLLQQGRNTKLEGAELDYAKKTIAYIQPDQFEKIHLLISRLHYHIERNAAPKSQMMSTILQTSRILAGEHVLVDS